MSADPWATLGARRRGLTTGDRALWRAWAAAAKVRPLPGHAFPEPLPVPVAAPAPPPAPPSLPPRRTKPAQAAPVALEVGQSPGGLDARRWRDLSRGKMRPERVLDLHGRYAQDAHGAVRRFLAEAMTDGLRCVAIVTGKGGPKGGTDVGVLRRELPHWLNAPDLRPLVLGAAHPHATNPGAVHLLLRRGR